MTRFDYILSVLVHTDISMLEPGVAVEKNKVMKSVEGIKVLYVPMTILGTNAVGGGGSHHILGTVNFEEKRVKI